MARKRYSAADFWLAAAMFTVVESDKASVIWLASMRFQTRSYSRNWSEVRCRRIASGSRCMDVGLMASWASWAPLTFLVYTRGDLGAYSAPNLVSM